MDRPSSNASQKASKTKDNRLENLKIQSEDVIDLIINSEIQSPIGSINPAVVASYAEKFPNSYRLSENVSKTDVIHKESLKTLSNESVLDVKESKNSKNDNITDGKKASKDKTVRRNQSPRPPEISSEEAESDAEKSKNSEKKDSDREKKASETKTYHRSQSPQPQEMLSEEAKLDAEELKNSKNNGTARGKKVTETKTVRRCQSAQPQETSSEGSELDAEKPKNGKNNEITPRKKTVKTKKIHGRKLSSRVTRSVSKLQELSSPKHETRDFFGSLDWYESDKSYYDKKLQIVLDDFESSELSDTGKGKQYYDYLLLDSRVSGLTEWPGFIRAVFYAGKGKNKRAFDHIKEAEKVWMEGGKTTSKKISRILDIFRSGWQVIVLTAADGLVELEALTREALVIETLGKQRLCNKNYGSFYGVAAVLGAREKHELGATLLVKAREQFMNNAAASVFSPVRLKKPLQLKCESEKDDNDPDNAALTVLVTKNYPKDIKTKRIEDYFLD